MEQYGSPLDSYGISDNTVDGGQKQTCLQNLTTVLSAIGIIKDSVGHGHVPSRPMFVAITMFTEEK